MNKKHLCFYILIILILSNATLFAADFVVPVIKAPYAINNVQFDTTGDYFAYEVNGKFYIRDSLSFVLKDSFARNTKSNFTAFYDFPDRVEYPKTIAIPNGNSITIQTQRTAVSPVETSTIDELPARAKFAAVNKNLSHIAFLGDNGMAYVVEIATNKQLMQVPYNISSSGICFTQDNKIIFSDSSKTAGLFNLTGSKIRTFTTANSIKGLSLSADNETLVVYDNTGVINLYNTGSSTQIGYIPNLGSKLLKDVTLSNDSRRILINGENNTLYVVPVQDVLFSQNTVAPTPKQFLINYNAQDPNDKSGSGITEFGIKEFQAPVEDVDAEYILSTREKNLGKQNFELEEEHKAGETIVLSTQPEQAYFPPSIPEKDREVIFSEKTDGITENQVKVQEFKQPKEYLLPIPEVQQDEKVVVTTPPKTYPHYAPQVNPVVPQKTVPNTTVITDSQKQPNVATQTEGNAPGNITIIINGDKLSDKNNNTEITVDEKKSEKELAKEEKQREREEKQREREEKKAEKQKEKEELKKIPLRERMDEGDLKTLFKDGHGLLFNFGLNKVASPYNMEFVFVTGYKNYDLIKPFYFGGILEPFIEIPGNNFPFKYKDVDGTLKNPYLMGLKLYSPIGFCIYPLRNSFEVYFEIGLGASLNLIWNGRFPPYSITTGIFTGFFGTAQLGIAWDFLNLGIVGNIDAITGFSYGINLGAIINIGGSRTIGSLKFK